MSKRILTKEHLEKLKKGRASRGEKLSLVCALSDKVQIWKDKHQYILRVSGKTDTHHPFLEQVLEATYELMYKELLSQQTQKDLTGLLKAINEHRQWFDVAVKNVLVEHLEGHLRPKL